MAAGFKKFPFAWRKAWLELFQESPTAAAVWDYMWWRSNAEGIFDLYEEAMLRDLKLNPKTLHKARTTIERHHGFHRLISYKDGMRIVRYQMKSFTPSPENGLQAEDQETDSRETPKTDFSLKSKKRAHTVDTDCNADASLAIRNDSVDTYEAVDKKQCECVGECVCDESVADAPSSPVVDEIENDDWKLFVNWICSRFSVTHFSGVIGTRIRRAHPWFVPNAYNLEQLGLILDQKYWKANVRNLDDFAYRWESENEKGLYARLQRVAVNGNRCQIEWEGVRCANFVKHQTKGQWFCQECIERALKPEDGPSEPKQNPNPEPERPHNPLAEECPGCHYQKHDCSCLEEGVVEFEQPDEPEADGFNEDEDDSVPVTPIKSAHQRALEIGELLRRQKLGQRPEDVR